MSDFPEIPDYSVEDQNGNFDPKLVKPALQCSSATLGAMVGAVGGPLGVVSGAFIGAAAGTAFYEIFAKKDSDL